MSDPAEYDPNATCEYEDIPIVGPPYVPPDDGPMSVPDELPPPQVVGGPAPPVTEAGTEASDENADYTGYDVGIGLGLGLALHHAKTIAKGVGVAAKPVSGLMSAGRLGMGGYKLANGDPSGLCDWQEAIPLIGWAYSKMTGCGFPADDPTAIRPEEAAVETCFDPATAHVETPEEVEQRLIAEEAERNQQTIAY